MTESGTGSVEGVVRGAGGEGVPDASVTVADGPGPVPDLAALTNEAGRFVLDGLPPGTYLLRALAGAGESGEAVVYVYEGATAQGDILLHEPPAAGRG